jgi:hypothetical protein
VWDIKKGNVGERLRMLFQPLISSKKVLIIIPPEEINYLVGDTGEYKANLAKRKLPWLLKNIPIKLNRQHQAL